MWLCRWKGQRSAWTLQQHATCCTLRLCQWLGDSREHLHGESVQARHLGYLRRKGCIAIWLWRNFLLQLQRAMLPAPTWAACKDLAPANAVQRALFQVDAVAAHAVRLRSQAACEMPPCKGCQFGSHSNYLCSNLGCRWVVNGTAMAIAALLGEWLCVRRELQDIPMGKPAPKSPLCERYDNMGEQGL